MLVLCLWGEPALAAGTVAELAVEPFASVKRSRVCDGGADEAEGAAAVVYTDVAVVACSPSEPGLRVAASAAFAIAVADRVELAPLLCLHFLHPRGTVAVCLASTGFHWLAAGAAACAVLLHLGNYFVDAFFLSRFF